MTHRGRRRTIQSLADIIFTHLMMMFRRKMIPEELEKLVIKHKEEGHLPFFVNCTTGTTVYGAYDPISEIAGESQKVTVTVITSHFVFTHF